MAAEPGGPAQEPAGNLRELATVFLKLGTIAFGGPAAHTAMMEGEVVERRRWLDRGTFLDFVGATNLIPGPNSTELALHIGYLRAGWRGLLTAGVCFILPAALIAVGLAELYRRFGSVPDAAAVLESIKPIVVAVVAHAVWRLGRTAVKDVAAAVLGLASLVAILLGVHELAVLAAAALVMVACRRIVAGPTMPVVSSLVVLRSEPASAEPVKAMAAAGVIATATGAIGFSLTTLFLTFAKIGAVLFGSGYVLFAFLRTDFVERLGWISESQLLDIVAIGQVIPGPLFTVATFIGYWLAGPIGALVGTAGIFLPAFVFVALSGPLIPRLRRSATVGAALDGLNLASLALMAAVTGLMARTALHDPFAIFLGLAAFILLWRFRLGVAWLVLVGAVVGLIRVGLLRW